MPTQPTASPAASLSGRLRGTQSLVQIFGYCWSHPALLLIELAWRWSYGALALLLMYYEGSRLLASVPLAPTGVYEFSLQDTDRATVIIANVWSVLTPPLFHLLIWLAPLLGFGWALASGIGRSYVLCRYAPDLPFRPRALILLQLLRVLALGGSFVAWFAAIQWSANTTLSGESPNLVLYFALVICISLGIFTFWALVSWVFSVAPLLALLEHKTAAASLARSLRLGPLSGKLVEVNLVLGIVKLALVVLAMVFSATPLPFSSVMAGTPLYLWWAGVTVAYLAASDFFQVARLVAFIRFWRIYDEAP
ncbi:hypothetical protein ACPOL_1302 [Acidisarcina polymorpha]|uniref:Uncharacterized protein n=1 Tax=Acidisarcina polymorpha TaxID=2211140 RepID=A0A2Z5FV71_9BACT|nr:hypothetical protein [Acidisarcina polymorpha]AXC10650.1 hypothetical protein ACPOL_1302 [Acidisarcina polymorpha]